MTGTGDGDEVDRLREVLRDHPPVDDRERASLAAFLDAFDRLDRPFDRSADPTHVTASGIVVGERGVVLHMHRRLGRWLQPGGHLEAGEPPEEAAVRECREETGLEVIHPPAGPLLLHLDVHRAARNHVHLDFCYLVLAPDLDPCPPPEESQAVAWFSWEAAEGLADGGLSAALRSARRVMPTPTGHQGWKEPR
jgi:8-oxo-dGTP pyrophosphatase MutT (NUDIX family)